MSSSPNGYYERGWEKATNLLRKIIPKPIRLPLIALVLTSISAWYWISFFNRGFSTGRWTSDDRWGIHMAGGEGFVFALAITAGGVWCWFKWVRSLLRSRSGLRAKYDRSGKR